MSEGGRKVDDGVEMRAGWSSSPRRLRLICLFKLVGGLAADYRILTETAPMRWLPSIPSQSKNNAALGIDTAIFGYTADVSCRVQNGS